VPLARLVLPVLASLGSCGAWETVGVHDMAYSLYIGFHLQRQPDAYIGHVLG